MPSRNIPRLRFGLVCISLAIAACAKVVLAADPPASNEQIAVAREAIALLRQKCIACHGEAKDRKGELDLRSREAALKGGETGEAALVPHKPDESSLLRAITWTDDELQMPPKENDRLTADEVALVKRWIEGGAVWPDDSVLNDPKWQESAGATGVRVKTSGGISADWDARSYAEDDLWAWKPLRVVEIPWAALYGKTRHPIDAFIDAELRRRKIEPAPPATAQELLRRATFDLTGLPPTSEEIREWGARSGERGKKSDPVASFPISDPQSPIPALLDRLLASPRYGERQAQHWLDVVRYADTDGFSNDFERPHAWRYRDYVIRSFNADKPYDRFIVEQIAGDELEPNNSEMLVAVGFLRTGPWEQTAMSVAAVTRQMFLDDVTNSVGITFLGQGMSCCRCHDHKFDPLPTRDYYALQAVFAGTQFADRAAPFLSGEAPADAAAQKAYIARQQKFDALLAIEGNVGDALVRVQKKRGEYLKRAMQRYEPVAFSVENRSPGDVHILTGGRLESPTERVAPGVLSAMVELGNSPPVNVPTEQAGRRLALARWIASDKNTLTARVIVNRVWQQHFGVGLVATPNNFGKMGKRPTHPELLDWLARWFMDEGWSIKKLHRLVMTSAAYQRSSRHLQIAELRQQDPYNQALAYFTPRRLSAEELRDAMLHASGELRARAGGPGVFPEINREVALQPRHIMGGVAPAWMPSLARDARHRRAIYAFRARTLADPLLEVFNQPGSDLSCERREQSNVPTQAFELFNGEFSRDRAIALAARLTKDHADSSTQIAAAFRAVLGREPTPEQLARCEAHLAAMLAIHQKQSPVAEAQPDAVEREMIAEQSGEPFRWEERLDWQGFEADAKPWDVAAATRALAEVCLVLFNANEFVYVY